MRKNCTIVQTLKMQKQTSFFDGPDLPSVSLFFPLLSESLRSLFRCIRRQISRYHRPSDAAIRLSLRLNLKCPPASAHLPVNMHMFDCGVTDEGRNWTENSFLLQERRAACRGHGRFCQSRFGDGDVLGCTPSHIGDEQ